MRKQSKPQPEGLIGLFGHTYIADPDNANSTMIECQFQVISQDGWRPLRRSILLVARRIANAMRCPSGIAATWSGRQALCRSGPMDERGQSSK
jgi:hypothetical protein